MKVIDFMAEDSKGYKVKTWISAQHVRKYSTVLSSVLDFWRAFEEHHLHDFRDTMQPDAQRKIANCLLCKYTSIIEE